MTNRLDDRHGYAIAVRSGFADGFAGRAHCSHCLWTADFEPHSHLGPGEAEQTLDERSCGVNRCRRDLCIKTLKDARSGLIG